MKKFLVLIFLMIGLVSLPLDFCFAQTGPFQGQVILQRIGNRWDYTIINNEPSSGTNYIGALFISLEAPITNVHAPNGWTVDTDLLTYVQWYDLEDVPFPNAVHPSSSLNGFSFDSNTPGVLGKYIFSPLEGSTGDSLPEVEGEITVPGIASSSSAPEHSSIAFVLAGFSAAIIAGLSFRFRRVG